MRGVLPSPDEPHAAPPADPRQRFRSFLLERVTSAHALEFYMAQAVPQFAHDSQARLAVEELVDHAGRMLGFVVDRQERWDCSVWRSTGVARLIVNVETSAGAASAIGQFQRRRDLATDAHGGTSAEPASGLTVVCGDAHQRLLEDAVIVRRAADHVRLVTTDALVRLVTCVRADRASHRQAVTILRPAGAFADALIPLLEGEPSRADDR